MPNALIWGAKGGIGAALAAELLSHGWTVVGVARSDASSNVQLPIVACGDFADDYEVRRSILDLAQEQPNYDLMVYAAGDIVTSKVADMDAFDWQEIMNANLTGPFLTTRHALPLLTTNAAIVYVGAVQERLRLPGLSAYAATKSGLEAFVEALAKEERRRKVLLVRPGAVDTPFWTKVSLRLPKDALAPTALATRIIEAIDAGQTGVIDL